MFRIKRLCIVSLEKHHYRDHNHNHHYRVTITTIAIFAIIVVITLESVKGSLQVARANHCAPCVQVSCVSETGKLVVLADYTAHEQLAVAEDRDRAVAAAYETTHIAFARCRVRGELGEANSQRSMQISGQKAGTVGQVGEGGGIYLPMGLLVPVGRPDTSVKITHQ